MVALSLFVGLAGTRAYAVPVPSATPPAGAVVGNQASATYTDGSDTERTVTSNTTVTVVQQVASVGLTNDGSKIATPGGQVSFPHTVTNLGNGSDSFTLSAVDAGAGSFAFSTITLYADANQDGVPDNATAITASPSLAPSQSFSFVVVAAVPGGASIPGSEDITVTATSVFAGGTSATNTDSVTLSSNAVISMTKTLDILNGPSPAGPLTYTLTYTNTGNTTATALEITDQLPAGVTYVAGSGRWSVLGTTALTDADDGDQTSGANSIDYSIDGSEITAIIAAVQPGQSGTLRFQVNVDSGLAPGFLDNSATFDYNNGVETVSPQSTNTARYEVLSTAGVLWDEADPSASQTVASANQGGVVSFTNVVKNTGNGSDTFDVTLTGSTFPVGTTFALFQADGVSPMMDSNGNSTPDTGPLAAGATRIVVLKATLPTGASGDNGGAGYTVTKVATSTLNSGATDTTDDTLTEIVASVVDLENDSGDGDGAGPEGAAVRSVSVNPGTTAEFTLVVQNDGSVSDSYNLEAAADALFASPLAAGWTVTYRTAPGGGGSTVSNTGNISAGGSKTFYARVSVPAGNSPGSYPVYFRAISPTSTVSDIIYDEVVVNTVRLLGLTANNTGQIFPSGSVSYSHVLTNQGNVAEALNTIDLTTEHSLSGGWTSAIYHDVDGDGTIDASDPIITQVPVTLSKVGAPGATINLIVKVYAPHTAVPGTVDSLEITAEATGLVSVFNTDTTTVVSGDLSLTKMQSVSTDGGTTWGAFSTSQASASPGDLLKYQITITNTGSAEATGIEVSDATPTFTKYHATPAAVITIDGVTDARATVASTIADGSAGTLTFTIDDLQPGESAVATFVVKIDG